MPPNQAELMYEKIKAKGLATALVMFPGAHLLLLSWRFWFVLDYKLHRGVGWVIYIYIQLIDIIITVNIIITINFY